MKCSSCNREIVPKERVVVFPCPFCENEIVRCEKCRTLVNPYKCGCGFEGP